MLRDEPCKTEGALRVDGASVEFSRAHEGAKVSTRTSHATLGSHGSS